MRRIVDDLLLLAKAERPDFLTPCAVELADLTVDVVSKAGPMGERLWKVDALAEQVIHADGQRLTQALMQLASNAARHTASPHCPFGPKRAPRKGNGTNRELSVLTTRRGQPPRDEVRLQVGAEPATRGVPPGWVRLGRPGPALALVEPLTDAQIRRRSSRRGSGHA